MCVSLCKELTCTKELNLEICSILVWVVYRASFDKTIFFGKQHNMDDVFVVKRSVAL